VRDQFLLDPDLVFLNHGSFGACPRPVFEAYQRWQRELERNPVELLGRRSAALLWEARGALAGLLGARREDLVFVTNATVGVNTFARSLDLRPGDEILSTDHEYGACDDTFAVCCRRAGATYARAEIPLPYPGDAAFVEALWAGVTPRTRAIFLSHVTSPTALVFPIAAVCRRARAEGILAIVDGAHAPGQLELDLDAIGADLYTGNCHKWLCAPKGSAFLHARPELHGDLHGLVVSWGYGAELRGDTSNDPYTGADLLARRHQWHGTRDLSAFLAVPDAIDFWRRPDVAAARASSRDLAIELCGRIAALTGLPPLAPPGAFGQMVAAALPPCDPAALQRELFARFRIEVPCFRFRGRPILRASLHVYNTHTDVERLCEALTALL
jgi:isopenicillin-N epimerase